MAKWRLFIVETRHTIYEIDAPTAEEGARLCIEGKGMARAGVIEAVIEKKELIEETPVKETTEKFNPLDKSFFSN